MFGVVLWSDTRDRNAVIWCEDHGDLAFYRQKDSTYELCLDAGDWVEFDLQEDDNPRMARNPRLISGGLFADLPVRLGALIPGLAASPAPAAGRTCQPTVSFLRFAAPAGTVEARHRQGAAVRRA